MIGDFNDLNVLVAGEEAHLVDADSFRFGSFPCEVYTERFLDPLRCDPAAGLPVPVEPPTADSDWYAFAVMLMQSLLYVGPYGGVFRPRDPAHRLSPAARPLHRITVFHPEVRYPRPALPPEVLPDDLLERFHRIFERDDRDPFPRVLLEDLRWTRCGGCGFEHARAVCPRCSAANPAAVHRVVAVRGEVRARTVLETTGLVLIAAVQDGALRWLVHEDGAFRREDGGIVTSGDLEPAIRYRVRGADTLLGRGARVVTLRPDGSTEILSVDRSGAAGAFDANAHARYWIDGGRLLRDGRFGPEHVGDVLPGQTWFRVGDRFGLGFYRAADLSVAFVFDVRHRGLRDGVALPRIAGQLVDASCAFAGDRAWVGLTTRDRGRTRVAVAVVARDGTVEATFEGEPDRDDPGRSRPLLAHLAGRRLRRRERALRPDGRGRRPRRADRRSRPRHPHLPRHRALRRRGQPPARRRRRGSGSSPPGGS